MNPERLEQVGENPERRIEGKTGVNEYHWVEYGDKFGLSKPSVSSNNPSGGSPQGGNSKSNQTLYDVIVSMISAGFTPGKNVPFVLQQKSNNPNLSITWLAYLIERIIRQVRNRKK